MTLPDRDTVQLTIYNSADLTMVKETRHLTFRKGLNKLEFSWANTLIDPTSVEFHALTQADQVDVLDVRFPPRVTNTLEWHIHSAPILLEPVSEIALDGQAAQSLRPAESRRQPAGLACFHNLHLSCS